MTQTLGDRLQTRRRRIVGRDALVESLSSLNSQDSTLVAHVHGVAGVGKSMLLEEAARRARETGVTVVDLDCGEVEPTGDALLRAIGERTGWEFDGSRALPAQLSGLSEPWLLILDGYEVLWMLDTWLRIEFIPALPETARVIFGSRDAPLPAWLYSPEWQGAHQSIELGPLEAEAALELLQEAGVRTESALRINAVANGHPLALTLAAATLTAEHSQSVEDAAIGGVVAGLAGQYVDSIDDAVTLRAVEAASVTRRSTRPVLAAQLPNDDVDEAYARLEALPFVRVWRDGLGVHEAVRDAISTRLGSADPLRHRELRRAAWRQIRGELRNASESELWHYTADILYLMRNPLLRGGFFPSGGQALVIEPAIQADHAAIREILELHDGPEAQAIMESWLECHPEAFRVVRDETAEVVAFRCSIISDEVNRDLVEVDPILKAWVEELNDPVHEGLNGFLFRRWLTRAEGEGPSAAQGLCWIDCKRSYLELRGRLGSVFTAVRDLDPYEAALAELGFREVPHGDVELDGETYRSVLQDFGPAGVDGWFARIVGRELGVDPTDLLDASSHELLLKGSRIALTPLEYEVMNQLAVSRGVAVSHADLVERVWGYDYSGESNVDAVVIRGLRAKLGADAPLIETVRGVGYRLLVD